jgi:hypothetical protein
MATLVDLSQVAYARALLTSLARDDAEMYRPAGGGSRDGRVDGPEPGYRGSGSRR